VLQLSSYHIFCCNLLCYLWLTFLSRAALFLVQRGWGLCQVSQVYFHRQLYRLLDLDHFQPSGDILKCICVKATEYLS